MTNVPRHGKASAFSAYWQLPLLRVMLRSTGLSGLLAPAIGIAFAPSLRPEYLLSVATGGLLLALSFARFERARLVAFVYVSVALGTAVIFGARFAWTPDVVVVLSYLGVAGGLLFGARFVYAVVALVACLLLLGGLLVQAGAYSIHLPPELNPAVYRTWLRTALGFALLAGAGAWVLRQAVAGVTRAEDEGTLALSQARDRWDQTEASRVRRLHEEQALLDAQKLQSVAQLGDGFAHVVSNSLTVVRCACEDVRLLKSEAACRAAASAIREAVKGSANRTRDLLLLSRPHTSLPASIELHREVRAQAQNLEQRLRRNVRCEFALEPAGSVLVPPSWLPQILTNLLLNAEGAIHDGGTIKISTRTERVDETRTSAIDRLTPGDYAALEIADDGEGMTREVMAHACEPFFTTRGRAGHDGLGLTLVHNMMCQVGGTLGLSSDGRGSRVTLYFPIAPETSEASERENTDPPRRDEKAAEAPPPPRVAPAPSELSPAERAVATLADPGWRINALIRTARWTALVALLSGAALAIFLRDDWRVPAAFVVSMGPLLILGSRSRLLSYRLRLLAVLGVLLGTGILFLAWYSYMSPGTVAVLTQAVFLATLFGDRRIALTTLLLATLAFVACGTVWPQTQVASPLQPMLFDEARNWFRIGVIFPLVLLVNGYAVLDVFRLAAERVPVLDRARRELEHRQQQHQAETEALLRASNIRGRAERTATAGRVTGVVAHDLNNSLMALLGWAELLEEADAADEALENLEQAVQHAEALLHTLRGSSEQSHRGPGIDLGLALGRARAMLQAVWQTDEAQRCKLEVHSGSGCFVALQEGSFRRLLVNLVTNARHALADHSGSCTVRLVSDSSGVQLCVSDTGSGMDAATQARIFEPFFTTKPGLGTGLGLLSVSEIVGATEGSLEVSSEPGRGSTFAIHWPLAEAGAPALRDSAPPVAIGSLTRVLLVEDEPLVRELLARGLRFHGYDVIEAEDGDAALRQLHEREPFDLLCTDAVMPGRSVLELISEYQAKNAKGPVLVISGYLPENFAPLLTRAGVSLLRKPFSHSELAREFERLRRVRSTAAGHGAQRSPVSVGSS